MFYGVEGYGKYVVRQFMDVFPHSVFVDEADGKITGYAVVGPEAFGKKAWLLAVAVDRSAQRRGIGAALTRRCLQYCEDNRLESCSLTVDPKNTAAVELYGKYGFVTVQEPSDYFGDGHKRIVMRKSRI